MFSKIILFQLSWLLVTVSLAMEEHLSGGTTILTVGTDNGCDYNNIQDAIDAAPLTGSTEIRISIQQEWNERLNITNRSSLSLRGRYTDCSGQNAVPHTVIKGGLSISSAPAVTVTDSVQISLYGIEIKDAAYSGGIEVNNSQVNMSYLRVVNNQHRTLIDNLTGGGLYVNNHSDVSIFDGFFYFNHAGKGGAIACLNSDVTIRNTQISNNFATNQSHSGKGGGIYAADGCELEINNQSGVVLNNATINNNAADHQGGGLYVSNSSQVKINNPNHTDFVNQTPESTAFHNNKITSDATLPDSGGAGIAVTGLGTDIEAYHLILGHNGIDSSTADGGGGALLLQDQATFSMKVWQSTNDCDIPATPDNRSNRMCNQIYHHTAFTGNKGAVAYLKDNAQADIYQSFMAENMASQGHLAYVDDATLRMQGNVITQNGNTFLGGGELIYATNSGDLITDFTTFTNNRLGSGLGTAYVVSTSQAGLIHISRSIIDEAAETDVFENSIDTTSIFNCLLSHEADSFTGTDITVNIPHYQPTWPYHLHELSEGINMCKATGALPNEVDIDGDARGICTGVVCPIIRYDAGADEYRFDDVIFTHGFE